RMGVISDLCRRVSKALGINYAGIDILPDGDGERNYILEAHSFPGYERGFDLMRFLANRI
ncbi:MAG: hypothetical protein ACE5GG_05440, partial [Candidatus Omnitrophota bacterium]